MARKELYVVSYKKQFGESGRGRTTAVFETKKQAQRYIDRTYQFEKKRMQPRIVKATKQERENASQNEVFGNNFANYYWFAKR